MSKLAQKIDSLHKSGQTVFSTNELALYWEVENKNLLYVQIARAKEKGLLKNIQRGLYTIPDLEVNKFELATSLQKNSYLSFETVLAKEGIINQWHGSYALAAKRQTEIANEYGKFIYYRLPEIVLNNRVGVFNAGTYFMATKERAVCDYFYRAGLQQLDEVNQLDQTQLWQIGKIYQSQRLKADLKELIKLI